MPGTQQPASIPFSGKQAATTLATADANNGLPAADIELLDGTNDLPITASNPLQEALAGVGTTNGGLNASVRNLTATADVVTTVAQLNTLSQNLTSFAGATVDTNPAFFVGQSNHKLLLISVGIAATYFSSGQATIQPYVATTAVTGSTGASGAAPLQDASKPLGASGTNLPTGLYIFKTSDFPCLAEPHLYMGFRLVFPGGAPSTGFITIIVTGTND